MDDNQIETFEAEYVEGFNQGYLIAKHLPELAGTLATVESQSSRMEGFRDGRKEYVLETLRSKTAEWQKADLSNNKDITPSKDRGMEPER